MAPRKPFSRVVSSVPPSGIRKFFDLAQSMQGVISLGVGEPGAQVGHDRRRRGVGAPGRLVGLPRLVRRCTGPGEGPPGVGHGPL